jgi:uracil-DNA glycosylase
MTNEKKFNSFYGLLNTYSDFLEYGVKKTSYIPEYSFEKAIDEFKIQKPVLKNNNEKKRKLIDLGEKILNCNNCKYSKNRVPGYGNMDAKIFVVSYPASSEENKAGKPLVGEAGAFFKKWLNAISLDFSDVFITDLLKCHPANEKINKENLEFCLNYLDKELEIIEPEIILTLGQLTISTLRKEFTNLIECHGKLFKYKNIPVLPIFHPLDVLKNESLKKLVWGDLKKFKKYLEENL